MVSIGVYARMMKHAGKHTVELLDCPFIPTVLLQPCQNLNYHARLLVKGLKSVLLINLFRDGPGLSVCGPRHHAVGRGGPHVHHHLLRLRGLAEGKHLPPPDGQFQSLPNRPDLRL